MCVIIHKPAGIIIPPEKIEQAWHNNKDGFGVTFDDRGEFNIRKWLSKDPDDINEYLEELKDCDAMIHLRFKTKGTISRDNLHPFTVLTQKKDGVNLQFFHNGTLSSFGDTAKSDSADFNETILQPMFKMLHKTHDGNLCAMLDDKFAHKVIDEFRNAGSVFTMFGDGGERLTFGKGVEHEGGWWSSNDHYFEKYKRDNGGSANVNFTNVTHLGYGQRTQTPSETKPKSGTSTTTVAASTNPPAILPKTVPADSWEELFPELQDLGDLLKYSHQDFEDLAVDYPYECAVLMRGLVQELFWKEYDNANKQQH